MAAIEARVEWDQQRDVLRIDYPKPVLIEDEAGVLAWEAVLERRIDRVIAARGGKLPAVICIDNLWVAAKMERRYAELADKLISRSFSAVARWTTRNQVPSFFVRANQSRELPSEVFASLDDAVAHVLALRRTA